MGNQFNRRDFLHCAAASGATFGMLGCGGKQHPVQPTSERPKGDRLAKPVPVEVDGKPLVREVYSSLFPFVGDGRHALLLGTREEGRLLIYRNIGAKGRPRLTAPQGFDDDVPTGRMPAG